MRSRGQGILEYVFMFLLIMVALLIMGLYIRNSLSGKLREAGDSFGKGEVYLPFGDTVVTESVGNE